MTLTHLDRINKSRLPSVEYGSRLPFTVAHFGKNLLSGDTIAAFGVRVSRGKDVLKLRAEPLFVKRNRLAYVIDECVRHVPAAVPV